jgi:hypothetical protein
MKYNYEAELVLKKPNWAQCGFDDRITISKEMFYDFEGKLTFTTDNGRTILENKWGECFVKEQLSSELIEWLKDKDFCLIAFKGAKNLTEKTIHFAKEEDRLHYLLKFVGKT